MLSLNKTAQDWLGPVTKPLGSALATRQLKPRTTQMLTERAVLAVHQASYYRFTKRSREESAQAHHYDHFVAVGAHHLSYIWRRGPFAEPSIISRQQIHFVCETHRVKVLS